MKIAALLVLVLWNAFLVGGCTYLVFWRDASPWWFALVLVLVSTGYKDE